MPQPSVKADSTGDFESPASAGSAIRALSNIAHSQAQTRRVRRDFCHNSRHTPKPNPATSGDNVRRGTLALVRRGRGITLEPRRTTPCLAIRRVWMEPMIVAPGGEAA